MSIYNLPSFLHSSWKLLLCVCVCVCVCLYIRTHTHTQIGYISTAHKPTRFQKSRPGYRQMLLPVRCSVAMETNHAMFMPVTQFPPVTTPATCIHHHRHHHRGTRILQISRSHPPNSKSQRSDMKKCPYWGPQFWSHLWTSLLSGHSARCMWTATHFYV